MKAEKGNSEFMMPAVNSGGKNKWETTGSDILTEKLGKGTDVAGT